MARAVQDAGNSKMLGRNAQTTADRCLKMTKYAEQFMTYTRIMRTQRWQHRNITDKLLHLGHKPFK